MAITLRSPREIELMRRAGAVVADVLLKLQEIAEPGITTADLDRVALDMATKARAQALFKGVRSSHARQPFPGAICASVNHEVVHGIPDKQVVLQAGDILSVDFGVRLDGYCGDAACTMAMGTITSDRKKLINVTKKVLDIAVNHARPALRWSQIATLMQNYAEEAGFGVVRDFVGHGIGTQMHEDPKVPNFVSKELLANDIILQEGMVLAIEPMINQGSPAVRTEANGWTVVTADGLCSAHFEHTVAITKDGCETLTSY